MCGRYAASTHPDRLIEIFEADEVPDSTPAIGPEGLAEWSRPRWNIAPTDMVPAVLERSRSGDARLLTAAVGLVPSWSVADGAARMINARLETVTRPAFRKAFAAGVAFARRRLHEWRTPPGRVAATSSPTSSTRTTA